MHVALAAGFQVHVPKPVVRIASHSSFADLANVAGEAPSSGRISSVLGEDLIHNT